MSGVIICPTRAIALARAVGEAAGWRPEEALAVADNLIDANLAGHDSHGLSMLATYIAMSRAGTMRAGKQARVISETCATLTLTGDGGIGQTIMAQAVDLACAKAAQAGVAVLALRDTCHLGRIGAWAEQAARRGFASIILVNVAGAPAKVVPHGGSAARLGTNPICLGFPRPGREPVVADMATSAIAVGKVRVAFNKGERLPEGLLVDGSGQPTTDPATMYESPRGALLPMAGHKGYALSVMLELFAGALAGGGTLARVEEGGARIINNAMAVFIDPAALAGPTAMDEEAARLEDWLRAGAAREGDAVLMPGEPESLSRAARAVGIPVDSGTWALLRDVAASLGVETNTYLD